MSDEFADLILKRAAIDEQIEKALTGRTRAHIQALRERRMALGMTQEQVAQACGLSRAQIANAEGGVGNLSLPAFFGYVQAVGGELVIMWGDE